MSGHKFPYRWRIADGYPAAGIQPHGCRVFGTFICGGVATMGYKLAGFEHLGGVEIDPKIAEIARKFITDLGGFEKFAEWGLV